MDEIFQKFEQFGFKSHMYPNAIGMWPEEQKSLVWCCLNVPEGNWIEIGAFMGGSACLMCLTRKSLGNKPKVISVDIDFKKWGNAFDRNVYRVGKFQSIHEKIEKSSWDLDQIENLSFAFIDGWHSFKGAYLDFQLVNKTMVKGGIVSFHDVAPQPYKDGQIDDFYKTTKEKYDELMSEQLPSGTFNEEKDYFEAEKIQNFMLDELVSLIIKEHNYELVKLPTINGETHFDRVTEYKHGTTSPYPGFVALRKL